MPKRPQPKSAIDWRGAVIDLMGETGWDQDSLQEILMDFIDEKKMGPRFLGYALRRALEERQAGGEEE